jgi:putative membrane protein
MTLLAHDTVPGHGSAWWLLLLPLLLAAGVWFARGALVVHRARRQQRVRLLAGVAGIAVATAAVVPPVEHMLESRFATHMAEHMMLVVVAAPLLALGAPGRVVWVGLPRRVRAWLARFLHGRSATVARDLLLTPAVAWSLHVMTLWFWHFPAPYDAALRSPVLHATEHALFLATAWLFWWQALAPSRRRLSPPFAALYVAAAALPSAALGAVLTFAPAPLYPAQARLAAGTGADVLADQQLAGMIMWVPADVVYLGVAVAIFRCWFTRRQDPVVTPLDARPAGPAPARTAGGGSG